MTTTLLPPMFIDTHTHIYTEDFADDREAVVARAMEAGADFLLLPNIDAASIAPMLSLCKMFPTICRPMIGLHPTEVPADPSEILMQMEGLLVEGHPFVAIGEVGVDLYWDATLRDAQMDAFRLQAEWAVRHRLPLVVHTRSAHREVVDTLAPLRDDLVGGIFHCFGGTVEEAKELLEFPNFALGIGGVVTFKKATLGDVLRETVPLERIVLETDAPYLAPTPHRGKRNEPSYIPLVAQRLAEVYETSIENVYETTNRTVRSLFSLNRLVD